MRENNDFISEPENSVFVYVSKSIYPSLLNPHKFNYMASFVNQLERLIEKGVNTIFFYIRSEDKFTLSLIEQAIYLAKRNAVELYIMGFSEDGLLPQLYSEYCKRIVVQGLGYEHERRNIYKYLSEQTAYVLGVFRANDLFLLDNGFSKHEYIRLNSNMMPSPDTELTCTVSAHLPKNVKMNEIKMQHMVISEINFMETFESVGMHCRIYGTMSPNCYSIHSSYRFRLNELYSFNQGVNSVEILRTMTRYVKYGPLRFTFGQNEMFFNGYKWFVGDLLPVYVLV